MNNKHTSGSYRQFREDFTRRLDQFNTPATAPRPAGRPAARSRRDENTLAPSEDVVERRRLHSRIGARNAAPVPRGAFSENLFMLIALVAVLYGLYRLGVHILMQS